MPTFTTVPPPTGAKSHASGPELLLMVLTGGVVVCAKAVAARRERNKTIDASKRKAPERNIRTRASRMEPPRECAQGAAKMPRVVGAGPVVCAGNCGTRGWLRVL